MALRALWGVFGARGSCSPSASSASARPTSGWSPASEAWRRFGGAVIAARAARRWGVGPVAIGAMLLSALGNAFIPLAPAGLPLVAIGCLVMQQLVADSAVTVYDVTEVSVRQTLVGTGRSGGSPRPSTSRPSWPS